MPLQKPLPTIKCEQDVLAVGIIGGAVVLGRT